MLREYCDICNKEIPVRSCEEKSRLVFQEYSKEFQMVLCKDCHDEIIRDIAIIAERKSSPYPKPIPLTP